MNIYPSFMCLFICDIRRWYRMQIYFIYNYPFQINCSLISAHYVISQTPVCAQRRTIVVPFAWCSKSTSRFQRLKWVRAFKATKSLHRIDNFKCNNATTHTVYLCPCYWYCPYLAWFLACLSKGAELSLHRYIIRLADKFTFDMPT